MINRIVDVRHGQIPDYNLLNTRLQILQLFIGKSYHINYHLILQFTFIICHDFSFLFHESLGLPIFRHVFLHDFLLFLHVVSRGRFFHIPLHFFISLLCLFPADCILKRRNEDRLFMTSLFFSSVRRLRTALTLACPHALGRAFGN